MERDELAAWLRLALTPGVGPTAARRLLAAFGLPQQVFGAVRRRARAPWLGGPGAGPAQRAAGLAASRSKPPGPGCRRATPRHRAGCSPWATPATRRRCCRPTTRRCCCTCRAVPSSPSGRAAIAIVGSRNPTPQGAINARQFARSFAQAGLTVVSGLALGIDGAAHEGALEGAPAGSARHHRGGRHRAGPRLSAPAPRPRAPHRRARPAGQRVPAGHAAAGAQNFPRRNRIIAGARPGHAGGGGGAASRAR